MTNDLLSSTPLEDLKAETELVPVEAQPLAVAAATDIVGLLDKAIDRGMDVATIERLANLHETMLARQAARDHADAFAQFQASKPTVPHNKAASFATRAGGAMNYSYADLSQVDRHVSPKLSQCGLSYSHEVETTGETVTCTCLLRHRHGHVTKSSVTLPIVRNNNALSGSQQNQIAITYGKRSSLCSALGIATAETDTDGAGPATESPGEPITTEQAMLITELMVHSGADRPKFFKHFRCDDVHSLDSRRFDEAVALLKAKIAEKAQ